MYYSDDIIEEVRSRNDIVDVISSYVKLKRSGGTYFGLCPFHNEKTPSFSVSPRKQMFYCFGCHKGGSVYTFVELYENFTFQEALAFLAQRAGIILPEQEETPEQKQRSNLKNRLLEVNRAAATFYYYQLTQPAGKAGLQYFKGRGLSDETIRNFGLGYAGKYSDTLYRYLKSKDFSDDLLSKSGLMQRDDKKGLYDRFWNRVMFPIMDVNNKVIGFGGRVLGDAKPKYLNSPENEIFNKRRNLYALNVARRTREDFLILCEGYMDVIAMHQAGFTCAVASLGTALTEEHASLLKRYTKEVILSYDSDSAGVNAALRAIPMLRDAGITVRVLDLKPAKDPDEFIRTNGPEAFRERLEKATGGFVFEVEKIKEKYRVQDPDERLRYQREIAQLIAGFALEAQRETYMQTAAPLLGISTAALREMVQSDLIRGAGIQVPMESRARRAQGKDEGIRQAASMLLSYLAAYPSIYPAVSEYLAAEDFPAGTLREAAQALYDQIGSGKILEASIIDHFADSEDQALVARIFQDKPSIGDTDGIKKAIRESLERVYENALKSGSADGTSLSLPEMIESKRKLEKLKNLRIELGNET